MTTHGKYCDFDFYVTSLDTENGYTATEPMSSGLSLLEAVSEFYKRCGRYPSSTNIMLGVEYTTSRRDLEPAGKGAAECAKLISDNLPEITDDPEKVSELIYRAADEYGIERCKAVFP